MSGWRRTVVLSLLCAAAAPAAAQEYQPAPAPGARVGADSVMSADSLSTSNGQRETATLDLAGVWRLRPGMELAARPVLYRNRAGEWRADVYQLAVRFDRPGAIRWRWEAGYLPSPVGILSLETRADQNPLILPATSYTAALPSFEEGTPTVQLASPLYPLAVQATAFAAHWDARAAVLGSSPVRVRPLTGADKPPAAPQLAVGGGVLPCIGLRLGGSFVYGRYASAAEVADPSRGDRTATTVGLDADYSFGYTRVYADWVHTAYERATDTARASVLTLSAVRTLSPRWFVAVRAQREATSNRLEAPAYQDGPYGGDGHTYYLSAPRHEAAWVDAGPASAFSVESSAGYRLTPGVTFRIGYVGYRAWAPSTGSGQAAEGLSHHAAASIVWSRRWR